VEYVVPFFQAGVADNSMNMNGLNPVLATNLLIMQQMLLDLLLMWLNLRKPCVPVGTSNSYFLAFVFLHIFILFLMFCENNLNYYLTFFTYHGVQLGRNKASPTRLAKLNEILSPEQKTMIKEWGWGGMMMVKATEMHVDLSM
jgi:hypothetical protein